MVTLDQVKQMQAAARAASSRSFQGPTQGLAQSPYIAPIAPPQATPQPVAPPVDMNISQDQLYSLITKSPANVSRDDIVHELQSRGYTVPDQTGIYAPAPQKDGQISLPENLSMDNQVQAPVQVQNGGNFPTNWKQAGQVALGAAIPLIPAAKAIGGGISRAANYVEKNPQVENVLEKLPFVGSGKLGKFIGSELSRFTPEGKAMQNDPNISGATKKQVFTGGVSGEQVAGSAVQLAGNLVANPFLKSTSLVPKALPFALKGKNIASLFNQGGLFAAPQAMANSLKENNSAGQVLQDTATGYGVGGTTSVVAGAIGAAIKGIADRVREAEYNALTGNTKASDFRISQELGLPTPGQKVANQGGLPVKMTSKGLQNWAEGQKAAMGQQYDPILQKLDADKANWIKAKDVLHPLKQQMYEGLFSGNKNPALTKVIDTIQYAADENGMIPPSTAQSLKVSMGANANWNADDYAKGVPAAMKKGALVLGSALNRISPDLQNLNAQYATPLQVAEGGAAAAQKAFDARAAGSGTLPIGLRNLLVSGGLGTYAGLDSALKGRGLKASLKASGLGILGGMALSSTPGMTAIAKGAGGISNATGILPGLSAALAGSSTGKKKR